MVSAMWRNIIYKGCERDVTQQSVSVNMVSAMRHTAMWRNNHGLRKYGERDVTQNTVSVSMVSATRHTCLYKYGERTVTSCLVPL
jgi:hypothetical protein